MKPGVVKSKGVKKPHPRLCNKERRNDDVIRAHKEPRSSGGENYMFPCPCAMMGEPLGRTA